jgi:hypothetical protein
MVLFVCNLNVILMKHGLHSAGTLIFKTVVIGPQKILLFFVKCLAHDLRISAFCTFTYSVEQSLS